MAPSHLANESDAHEREKLFNVDFSYGEILSLEDYLKDALHFAPRDNSIFIQHAFYKIILAARQALHTEGT